MKTCTTLRIGIVTCLLLPLGSMGQKQSAENANVSEAEYEVFSAYISQSFVGAVGEERVGKPVSQIVIVHRTESDKDDLDDLAPEDIPPGGVEKYLRKEAPSLQVGTINNFHRANVRQAQLALGFRLPLQYQLVPAEKIDSILKDVNCWPDYYKQYRAAQGYLALSRAGFRGDGKQALFYARNMCGGKCATASYVVMEKRGSIWKMVKEVAIWVS